MVEDEFESEFKKKECEEIVEDVCCELLISKERPHEFFYRRLAKRRDEQIIRSNGSEVG